MLKGLLIVLRRWLFRVAVAAVLLSLVFCSTTRHPEDFQVEAVACAPSAPNLESGQELTIMSWNVQFFAGTGYVFWFDVPGGDGPDTRPEPQAVAMTLDDVAALIDQINPDVLLLQEVDDGAARTGRVDQLGALQNVLAESYACSAAALYWRSWFV